MALGVSRRVKTHKQSVISAEKWLILMYLTATEPEPLVANGDFTDPVDNELFYLHLFSQHVVFRLKGRTICTQSAEKALFFWSRWGKDNLFHNYHDWWWYSEQKEGGEESGRRLMLTDSVCNGTTLRYINREGRQTSFTRSHYALMLRHTPASLLATRASHQHSKLKPHLTGTMDGQHKDRRQTHLWILTLLIFV